MSVVKNEKTFALINSFCIGQFIFCFIAVTFNKALDVKVILGLSAVFGILVSGMARRSFTEHRVDESTKPLTNEERKQHLGDDKNE